MKIFLVTLLVASVTSKAVPDATIFVDSYENQVLTEVDGCAFLSNTRHVEGSVIKGEYTYKDPLGYRITVTYQVNEDGTNYLENRILHHKEEDLLTADEVVRIVTTELKPTVIQIIRVTVEKSNIDLSNYDGLVETILVQLRPVVTSSVNNALSTSSHGHLDANELIDRILIELRPFVIEAIRVEVEAVAPKVSKDEVVQLAIGQVNDLILHVVQTTLNSGKVDLHDEASLVTIILQELRPLIIDRVREILASNNANYDIEWIVNVIIERITPGLTDVIRREVQIIKQSSLDTLVETIIKGVSPHVKTSINDALTAEG